MISQTLQCIFLGATSNIIAQAIESYTPTIITFAIFSLISNPPNVVWQHFLEDMFPTNVPSPPHQDRQKDQTMQQKSAIQINKTNVLAKFLLDQTFGAVLNTLMFVVYMEGVWTGIRRETEEKFWPMLMDGYKSWPLVSLVSFLWISADRRVVFGCAAGVVWNVYLSLAVSAQ
ncbi:hypothetical protein FB567DRAFT_570029 [Paraphoma chrysanthemicola]|uniref:Uncharacterized protein n=1 Tax=Paraphoma chrysanthemicola TaxID=798071 RepID=A0A8K0VY61_9PLEO|nr:hypothetical protein FB567DRAFT_570029 [Paraphoma chrysanthemicola]